MKNILSLLPLILVTTAYSMQQSITPSFSSHRAFIRATTNPYLPEAEDHHATDHADHTWQSVM